MENIIQTSRFWQMEDAEKICMNGLIELLPTRNCFIEVGTYLGGCLEFLSDKFINGVSIDIDFSKIVNRKEFKNITFVQGYSSSILPNYLSKFNYMIDFILIDADHEYNAVFEDLDNCLLVVPTRTRFVVLHDSWYINSRNAIKDVYNKHKDNLHIHYANLDMCDATWLKDSPARCGGLSLFILKPEERNFNIWLKENPIYEMINK